MPTKAVAEGIKLALSLIQQRKAIDAQLAELGVDESLIATMYGTINEVESVRSGIRGLKVRLGKAKTADGGMEGGGMKPQSKVKGPRKGSDGEKVLAYLKGGEKSGKDIQKHLDREQITPVMKGLLKLGLVKSRSEGVKKFWSLK